MLKKYQAIDIANYILWYANKGGRDYGITALKLQKILYYVAAKCLKERGEVLFDEQIEKWRFGPVTPSVYHAFKERRYGAITKPISTFEVDGTTVKAVPFDYTKIESDDVEIIRPVIDELAPISAFDLVDRTHREAAWKDNESIILNTWDNPIYTEDELLAAARTVGSE